MSLKNLFTVAAIIAVLIGLALVLVPAPLMRSYGVEVNDTAIYMARSLGAAYLGIGLISWLVRDSPGSNELRIILLGFFVINAVGFVISLISMLQGFGNALGWATVIIDLLLAAGFGYFYWLK